MRVSAALLALLFASTACAGDDKMVLVGAALFGAAYSPVAVAGTAFGSEHAVEAGGMYTLPVAGPIAYGTIMTLFGSEPWAALLIADGAIQLGGIVLMIVGAKRRP